MRRKCRVTSRGVLTEQMGSTVPRDPTSSTRATLEPRLRTDSQHLVSAVTLLRLPLLLSQGRSEASPVPRPEAQ